ncbi:hypothetical protein DI005_00555 [Prauserella sp. PE36]|uniref:AAA family ATPase n=1 Tax=Prauserella sp. PE36 TaxID=1504709 RepID=UPI000DE39117|nr:hypothetical protein DI005_00555 [Prauserella sp. PE36]
MAVDFPEPRSAVPGLLREGLNLLAGAPKLGKSWLSLGLGAAIANGDPALNAIEVERGRCCTARWRTPAARLQRRRRQMLAAGGRPAPLLPLETGCPTMSMGGAEGITGGRSGGVVRQLVKQRPVPALGNRPLTCCGPRRT